MTNIKTFVYFDLEATGLKCSGRPRITEISLVAVNSEDVEGLHLQIQNYMSNKCNINYTLQIENCCPRVLNKITLCVYPITTIMPEVSDITGLDNYNLTDQTRFDRNTGDLLANFLARFDFPLLKAELEKAGTQIGKYHKHTEFRCTKRHLFVHGPIGLG